MLPLLFALALASPMQTVRVIGPDPALIAAAALPVPDVALSRTEADALSDEALAQRLIGHIAHKVIVRTRRQPDDFGIPGRTLRTLDWVTFDEAGSSIGGRLCRSRTIHVTFASSDEVGQQGERERRPRRIFWINQVPTLAVIAGDAGEQACVAAPSLELPFGRFDEGVAIIRQLMAATRDPKTSGLAVACSDRLLPEPRPCAPSQALRAIDWTRLRHVTLNRFTGAPARWELHVGAGRGEWVAVVSDLPDGRHLDLRREDLPPPPF